MADSETTTARPGQRDLTSGPIASTLLAFALPTLGAALDCLVSARSSASTIPGSDPPSRSGVT